jgi:hypothetical protein
LREGLGSDPNAAGKIIRDRSWQFVEVFEVQNVGEGMGEVYEISKNHCIAETYGIHSNPFLAAVKASELTPVRRSAKAPLNSDWTRLMARIPGRRTRFGLSHLARYAGALGIAPEQVNDAVVENFIAAVRDGSLHRKPNNLHRMVAVIWNEVAEQSGLNLQPVNVPSFRPPAKRIEWTLLPKEFRNDVDIVDACGSTS